MKSIKSLQPSDFSTAINPQYFEEWKKAYYNVNMLLFIFAGPTFIFSVMIFLKYYLGIPSVWLAISAVVCLPVDIILLIFVLKFNKVSKKLGVKYKDIKSVRKNS
jgi:hypothetical protein